MPELQLTISKNGPILVSSPVTIVDGDTGNEIAVDKFPAALCRCGQSANKPFCDGTHKGSFEGACARANLVGLDE